MNRGFASYDEVSIPLGGIHIPVAASGGEIVVEPSFFYEPFKQVRFDENIDIILPPDEGETDQDDEHRWYSQADITAFREDAKQTIRALQACRGREDELDEDKFCLRGLEKWKLKRPPPNFVRNVLALQKEHKNVGMSDPTGLQLFSIACSKWARKKALQLGAEDEVAALEIFMAGLNKQPDDYYDDDYDDEYYGDELDCYGAEELDFCIPGEDFLDNCYDYKEDDPKADRSECGGHDVLDYGNRYPTESGKIDLTDTCIGPQRIGAGFAAIQQADSNLLVGSEDPKISKEKLPGDNFCKIHSSATQPLLTKDPVETLPQVDALSHCRIPNEML